MVNNNSYGFSGYGSYNQGWGYQNQKQRQQLQQQTGWGGQNGLYNNFGNGFNAGGFDQFNWNTVDLNGHDYASMVPVYGQGINMDEFFTFSNDPGSGASATTTQNPPTPNPAVAQNPGVPYYPQQPGNQPGNVSGYDINAMGTYGVPDSFFQFNGVNPYSDPYAMAQQNMLDVYGGGMPGADLTGGFGGVGGVGFDPNNPFSAMVPGSGEPWDGNYRDPSNFLPNGAASSGLEAELMKPGSTIVPGAATYLNWANYMKQLTGTQAFWQGGRVVGNLMKSAPKITGSLTKGLYSDGKLLNSDAALKNLKEGWITKENTASYVLAQQKGMAQYSQGAKQLLSTGDRIVFNTTDFLDPNCADVVKLFRGAKEVQQLAKIDAEIAKHVAKGSQSSLSKVQELTAQKNALAAAAAKNANAAIEASTKAAEFAQTGAGQVSTAINGQSLKSLSAPATEVVKTKISQLDTTELGSLYNSLDNQGVKTFTQLTKGSDVAVKAAEAAKAANVSQITTLAKDVTNTQQVIKMVASDPSKVNRAAYIAEIKKVNPEMAKDVMKGARVNASGSGLTVGNIAGSALSVASIALTAKQIIDRWNSGDKLTAGVAAVAGAAAGVTMGIAATNTALATTIGMTATTAATAAGTTAATLSSAATGVGAAVAVAFGVADTIKYFKNGEWERGLTLGGAMLAGAAIGGFASGPFAPVGALVGAAVGALVATIANIFVGKGKAQRKARDKEILPKLRTAKEDILRNASNAAAEEAKKAAKQGNYTEMPVSKELSPSEVDQQLFEVADQLSKLSNKDIKKRQKDQPILKKLEDQLTALASIKYAQTYNEEIKREKRKIAPGGETGMQLKGTNPFGSAVAAQSSGMTAQEQLVQGWLTEYLQANPSMANKSQEQLLQGFQSWLVQSGKVAA